MPAKGRAGASEEAAAGLTVMSRAEDEVQVNRFAARDQARGSSPDGLAAGAASKWRMACGGAHCLPTAGCDPRPIR